MFLVALKVLSVICGATFACLLAEQVMIGKESIAAANRKTSISTHSRRLKIL